MRIVTDTGAGPAVTTADRPPAAEDAELLAALGVLSEAPHPSHAAIAEALGLTGWTEAAGAIFTVELLPYAAIHLGGAGMLGGEPADRIGGFWHALGFEVPAEPDHLAALLGLYAHLSRAEAGEDDAARRLLRRQARATLLREHLLTWVPAYADAVAAAGSPAHEAWATALSEALLRQVATAGGPPARVAHLDDVPLVPERTADAAELIGAVLAPARSGMILTRGDLARCARELNTGVRVGERSYALRHLIEAAPGDVLDWLADEAAVWAARHEARCADLGAVADRWTRAAETTRHALKTHRDTLEDES